MKSIVAAVSILALLSHSFADDGPKNVQIDVEYIEVPEPVITSILHEAKPPKSGSAWKTAIDKLLKDEKARITASLSVTTKSGQRATVESVQELTYPTEFDPAKGRAQSSPSVPAQVTGSDVPTPTAFEMRPVGARFEVEPTIGQDGKTIDLNIAPEITSKDGESVHQEIPNGTQTLATIRQPVFHTAKSTTSVTLFDGGSTLLGILIPHNEAGENDSTRRVLCVVTARLIDP